MDKLDVLIIPPSPIDRPDLRTICGEKMCEEKPTQYILLLNNKKGPSLFIPLCDEHAEEMRPYEGVVNRHLSEIGKEEQ